jgi:hypothetical protein
MEQAELDYETKEHREAQREAVVFKVLRHTASALAARGLRYLALMITAIFFGVAVYDPVPLRLVAAGIFAAGVFLPVLYRNGGGDHD